jgi:hypothetical protein
MTICDIYEKKNEGWLSTDGGCPLVFVLLLLLLFVLQLSVVDEGLNLSSHRLRAYHNRTAFFQAYAENCTPSHAGFEKQKRRAQMQQDLTKR